MGLTLFKRLVIGNIIILLFIFALGSFVVFRLNVVQKMTQEIVAKNQQSILFGDRLLDSLSSLAKFGEKYFVSRDINYYNRFTSVKTELETEFQAVINLMETDEQKELSIEAFDSFTGYLKRFEEKADLSIVGETIDIDLFLEEAGPLLKVTVMNLKKMTAITRSIIADKLNRSSQMSSQIRLVTGITTVFALFLGMLITTFNTRSITKSVTRLQQKTKEIARGHFEEIQTIKGPKEIQDLSVHFNTMCRRLKELDSLKADFVSHVSHELRTPVTSIKGASTILSKGFYADNPEKQRELFLLIHGECDRLLYSVMRILDYSKMEAKQMEYRYIRRSLPVVIRKSILKLAPLSGEKQIDLEFSPPQEDLPDVCIDEDRILEVLNNLIGNALKFTPKKGKVVVSCFSVDSGKKLIMTVVDNGPGIKPEHLEKIFYKFKQIDDSLGTRMGTGLGLSISKHIIKAHGGSIWAESQYSKGTKILVTLPAAV
ncbi:signal transduction histidine kinase [Desulforapulum autotrophicum HRM2]|uniref:histidine kinase n=1 Tax=Desulforapulum autotrophicum (strain ATCC 43914 / DSM 3382 / VKM B-1955 / HRM2) TaxID=177437 RepID=C0QCS9_DESAH|nr:HAMP domain-containing sensor histidine kinase [Desulforapulum autotrophicum]ACN15156.1 signal transduction histidine kinase [Desulforapulum autotrophicum HRM2]